MKRILSICAVLIFLAGKALGATYYINGTCAENGNGAAATCAASAGGAGAFNSFANFHSAITVTVGTGGHTINVVANSGPYYFYSGSIDWGRSGNTWNGNNNVISSGKALSVANGYKWTASANGTNEWYCTLDNDGNPSLSAVTAITVNGRFMHSTSTNPLMTKGTLGALTNGQYGLGDNDVPIAFSTIYVRWDAGNPGTLGVPIIAAIVGSLGGTSYSCATNTINGFVFEYCNTEAFRLKGNSWTVKNCLFRYLDQQAISTNAAVTGCLIYNNIGYYTGHRFFAFNNAGSEVSLYNNTAAYQHLFVLVATGLANGTLNAKNNISYSTESGFVDIKSAITFTEDHNIIHCNFSDTINKIGYISAANWAATAATDSPAAADTNTNRGAGVYGTDPLFVDAANGNFHLQAASPAIDAGVWVGLYTDFEGAGVRPNPSIGAYTYPQGASQIGTGSGTATLGSGGSATLR